MYNDNVMYLTSYTSPPHRRCTAGTLYTAIMFDAGDAPSQGFMTAQGRAGKGVGFLHMLKINVPCAARL